MDFWQWSNLRLLSYFEALHTIDGRSFYFEAWVMMRFMLRAKSRLGWLWVAEEGVEGCINNKRRWGKELKH